MFLYSFIKFDRNRRQVHNNKKKIFVHRVNTEIYFCAYYYKPSDIKKKKKRKEATVQNRQFLSINISKMELNTRRKKKEKQVFTFTNCSRLRITDHRSEINR
jgi:hypothetical protein